MENKEFQELVEELIRYSCENEWIEFKENNFEPHLIGEYISALSNSACLHKTKHGYLVFGINNKCQISGTNFKPRKEKGKGNENLENWLLRLLSPRIDFEIIEGIYKDKEVVIFRIDSAKKSPVKFDSIDYIRVGEYKHPLRNFPEKERNLWRILNEIVFEEGVVLDKCDSDEVLNLLNYPGYFDLMKLKLPKNKEAILEKLEEESLIIKRGKKYSVTNLGAILFANDLNKFPKLSRKKVRVIFYGGNSRTGVMREREHKEGYAILFKSLIQYILDQLPANEIIKTALREEVFMYPSIAIRELLANVLIHQDFFEEGTSPMVEFFDDRVEFTNPGEPLIDTNRFIDHAPISRNDKLAGFMRRVKICEEAGTGIDKVIESVEIFQLPAPEFIRDKKFVKVILYGHREFKDMTREDKIRACWQHCVLKYVSKQFMTNTTLRERFNLKGKNDYVQVSKIIRVCIEKGYIKQDESKRYIPVWA